MTDTDIDIDIDIDDVDRAWEVGIYPYRSGHRSRPNGIPAHLWPDPDTVRMGATLLAAPIAVGGFDAYERGGLGAAAQWVALTWAGAAAPSHQQRGNLARIGVPLFASVVALDAIAEHLDQDGDVAVAADVRSLSAIVWPPRRDQHEHSWRRRAEAARSLQYWNGVGSLKIDLDRIAHLAICQNQYFQASLRHLLRQTLHDDQLFRQPFAALRQAMRHSLHRPDYR